MLFPKLTAGFGCFVFAATLFAHTNWLTLTGDPGNFHTDVLEVDPLSRLQNLNESTLNIRASHGKLLTSSEGIPFRSYTATIRVSCVDKTARFVNVSYHLMSLWEGKPHRELVFSATEVRPLVFRFFEANTILRIVKSACASPVN